MSKTENKDAVQPFGQKQWYNIQLRWSRENHESSKSSEAGTSPWTCSVATTQKERVLNFGLKVVKKKYSRTKQFPALDFSASLQLHQKNYQTPPNETPLHPIRSKTRCSVSKDLHHASLNLTPVSKHPSDKGGSQDDVPDDRTKVQQPKYSKTKPLCGWWWSFPSRPLDCNKRGAKGTRKMFLFWGGKNTTQKKQQDEDSSYLKS